MLPINRQRRALIRNSLVFAGVAALALLLGLPAKTNEIHQRHANIVGQVESVMLSGNR